MPLPKIHWKTWLSLLAALIILLSLIYTNYLSRRLAIDEKNKVTQLAETFKKLYDAPETEDVTYYFDVIAANETIPLITTAEDGSILNWDNIRNEEPSFLKKKLRQMKAAYTPIELDLGDGEKQFLYYKESRLLSQLKWFPFVQLFIIGLFLAAAYYLFSKARQGEQNKVWVGMSKETAHQLGTPLSSLLAWMEHLKELDDSKLQSFVPEMEKDIKRLSLITDRFSKIGSKPTLQQHDLIRVIKETVDYMQKRSSREVAFILNLPEAPIQVPMYPPLFNWVLENLLKNALDAMDGKGVITIDARELNKLVQLDITDTGKGIAHRNKQIVFRPGFSTKQRGWGLGLSLSKRIIEDYHKGKIVVRSSEIGKGTKFRIKLNT